MCLPHVVLDDVLASSPNLDSGGVQFRDTSIRQVLELIVNVVRIVVLSCEAYIWRLPYPNGQWVDTCDHNPLPNIKLLSENYQRTLNVLLHYPEFDETFVEQMYDLLDICVDLNVAAS